MTLMKKLGMPEWLCNSIYKFRRREHNEFGNDWKVQIEGDEVKIG